MELFVSRNSASDVARDPVSDGQGSARRTCLLPTSRGRCSRLSVWVLCDCWAEAERDWEARPQVTCLALGETLWSHPSSFGRNASVLSSLLRLPDVDADGAPDLLVLTQEEKEVLLPSRPPRPSLGPLPVRVRPLLRPWFPCTCRQNWGLTVGQGTRPGPCAPGICRPACWAGSVLTGQLLGLPKNWGATWAIAAQGMGPCRLAWGCPHLPGGLSAPLLCVPG